jgi:hypothetical protein
MVRRFPNSRHPVRFSIPGLKNDDPLPVERY